MKMDKIYENASLTVVASLSSTDKDGFLKPRTQHLGHTFSIEHPSIENGIAELKVRAAFKKHLRRDIGMIRDTWRANLAMPAATPEPLDYRAWCYQEKIVSRRLLSFCIKEIEWDCQSGTDCECGGRRRNFETDGPDARNGSPRQVYQSLRQDDLSVHSGSLRGGDSRDLTEALVNILNPGQETTPSAVVADTPYKDENRGNAWLLWRTRLVPSYSQLRLTQGMDRLPALSAVARGLNSICGGGGYLAGMWLSDLATSLSWKAGAFATDGPQPGRPCSQYRAPSWSWASIEGAVNSCFDYEDDYQPICVVGKVDYRLAGKDPFSNVESASAHVRGHLIPATLKTEAAPDDSQNWPTNYYCRVNGTTAQLYMFPDTPIEQSGSSLHRVALSPGDSQSKLDCPVQLLAILMARPRSMIGFRDRTNASTVDFEVERWVTFLALTASGSGSDSFCRIGIVPRASTSGLSRQDAKWYERWPIRDVTLV